jgi:hypothetical protein
MDMSQLRDCMSLYGAQFSDWPEQFRAQIEGSDHLKSQLQVLISEELQFEQMLLSRTFEQHNPKLSQSIIDQSLLSHEQPALSVANDSGLIRGLQYFFARPALSMAATLVVGLILGYSFPVEQEFTTEESFDDYSQLLYDQDDIL